MMKKMTSLKIKKPKPEKLLIGWNEWCTLPELGIKKIKAKIDTGAKTSALHAFDVTPYTKAGKRYVRFKMHPLQNNNEFVVQCKAPIIDQRYIMSSNGHKEHRFVVATELHIGQQHWNIELTLSNRDPLTFRLLLGREALDGRVIIDPAHRLRLGKEA